MECSIELPASAADKYQDKSCEITVAVEAIQGNADESTRDFNIDVKKVYNKPVMGGEVTLGESEYAITAPCAIINRPTARLCR